VFLPTNKCEVCGKPATYKFTKIVNGMAKDSFYCDEHAQQNSPHIQKSPFADPGNLSNLKNLIKGIVENVGEMAAASVTAPEAEANYPDVRCQACGLTFAMYKRTLLLGCPVCYVAFGKHIEADLRKFHSKTRHTGRRPAEGATVSGEPAEEEAAAETNAAEAAKALNPPKGEIQLAPAEEELEEAGEPESIEEIDDPNILRGRLKEAVQREDFEQAARLRDRIRELEQGASN